MSSYESSAEPIKVGYLMDFLLPDFYPEHRRLDLTQSFEIVFQQAHATGVLDRPVEIVYKEVEGLPKGSAKAVIDAYGELVDEGCLIIFGPFITDNTVPTKEAIEEQYRVPSISVTGSEEWLGEWTFALSMGSMTDEPIFWADLCRSGGHTDVGVLIESSLVGESYVRSFRQAAADAGLHIVGEETIPQTAADITEQVRTLHDAGAEALVHCGFGFGIVLVKPALEALGWDPPRFMGTAWQNAWITPILWDAMMGFVGLDQLDESNAVGQAFLDDFEATYGRRPPDCPVLVNRDIATMLVRAFADAHPLTPRGVKEALERVKMIPAASGSPGTRLSFGKWTRKGWVGTGYLVARTLDADGEHSHLVRRFHADEV